MRIVLAVMVLLVVAGCDTSRPPERSLVEQAITERAQTASASIRAAKEVNTRNPEQNRHTEVIDRELEVSLANLPSPTERQLRESLARALAALEAENEGLQELYIEAMGKAQQLEDRLDRARERQAQLEAQHDRREQMLASQVRLLTWLGSGFLVVSVLLGFTGNPRMGIIGGGIGAILIGSGRALMILPDWTYYVFFGALAVTSLVAIGAMLWGYRTGLFQHPPKKVGEYDVKEA